ncbi:MAG TPA: aminotransferase class IV [Chthoniobacterales bacterium]
MSTSFQWENCTWQPVSGIPLTDRGFRHGMSAFETLRIHRGQLISLPEHLEKLRHACARLGLRIPPDFTADFPTFPENGVARIYVTAGDGSFRSPLNDGRIFLLTEEITTARQPPRSLIISTTQHTSLWPGLKTGNYWPHIEAYRNAAETRSDEVVLVNASKHVVSASLANLFAVIDDLLLTPRVSSGARAGVLRDWVMAREDVIVSDFHPEQLAGASEIFLTNSGYGIAPIHTLSGKPLPSRALGEKIQSDYHHSLDKQ